MSMTYNVFGGMLLNQSILIFLLEQPCPNSQRRPG